MAQKLTNIVINSLQIYTAGSHIIADENIEMYFYEYFYKNNKVILNNQELGYKMFMSILM